MAYPDPPPRRKWLLPFFIGGVLLLGCSGAAMLGVGFLSRPPNDYPGSPLTEDQRVAWEKFRRRFGTQPSCFVAEFVTPAPGWRIREKWCDRDQTKLTHKFDHRPEVPDEIIFNVGWGFFDSKSIDFAPAAREKQVEAKNAIARVQREVDAIKANYTPGLLGNDRLESLQDAITQSRQDLADAEAAEAEAIRNPPKVKPAIDDAVEAAIRAVAAPNVKAAAVVDLTSGPDPKALLWFRDDGKGAKELKERPLFAPNRLPAAIAKEEEERAKELRKLKEAKELKTPPAELDASLKAYLHELQTLADQL